MKATRELFDALRGWQWWPLIASLVLILAFLAGFYWRTGLAYAMCSGAEDENCAREWASALSGWAAFCAAVATVTWLKRQIEDANRHQNENIELTIMGRLATSRTFSLEAHALHAICVEQSKIKGPNQGETYTQNSEPFVSAKSGLLRIRNILLGSAVSTFERDIGLEVPSFVALNYITDALRIADEAHIQEDREAPISEDRSRLFWNAHRIAIGQSLSCASNWREASSSFSARWSARLQQ